MKQAHDRIAEIMTVVPTMEAYTQHAMLSSAEVRGKQVPVSGIPQVALQ
jgi:hypothetical protein